MLQFLCIMFLLQQASPAPKLSEPYGKAAFLALKAIERDTSEMGSKSTKEAIDLADAEAASDAEKDVTKALNRILIDREINNNERSLFELEYENAVKDIVRWSRPKDDHQGDFDRLRDKMDRQLKEIADREKACFSPFEESLRARDPKIPAACTGDALRAKVSASR